jgi:hypothetical protein
MGIVRVHTHQEAEEYFQQVQAWFHGLAGRLRLEIFSDDVYDAFFGWRTQFERLMRLFFGNFMENEDDSVG